MELIKATLADAPRAAEIYEAVKGGGFCVWSEGYPTLEHALGDARAGCLYLFTDRGELIGCASVEPVSEDDDLPFWRVNDGSHREISRIAVRPEHQGKGYARKMVGALIDELASQGVTSVHLLAAKRNLPAMSTYRALGFDFIGECYRYGADYYACEKLLCKK